MAEQSIAPHKWNDGERAYLLELEQYERPPGWGGGHRRRFWLEINGGSRDAADPILSAEVFRLSAEIADLRRLNLSMAQVADLVAWKDRLAAENAELREEAARGTAAMEAAGRQLLAEGAHPDFWFEDHPPGAGHWPDDLGRLMRQAARNERAKMRRKLLAATEEGLEEGHIRALLDRVLPEEEPAGRDIIRRIQDQTPAYEYRAPAFEDWLAAQRDRGAVSLRSLFEAGAQLGADQERGATYQRLPDLFLEAEIEWGVHPLAYILARFRDEALLEAMDRQREKDALDRIVPEEG